MTVRNSHDLDQIRPSAELDRVRGTRHGPGPGPGLGLRGRRRRTARNPRAPRQRWPLWRKVITGFAALIALSGIGLAALLYVVGPAELVRKELIRQVKSATGRDLAINGRAGLVFFPNLGVTLGDVRLSGPPGMDAGPTLTADRIDLNVALIPLLSRKIQIEHAALVRPMIDLRVDTTGRQTWQFAYQLGQPIQHVKPVQLAALGNVGTLADLLPTQNAAVHRAHLPRAAGADFLEKFELRSVSLIKARIRYQDDRTGRAHHLDDFDMRLLGRRMTDPLSASGGLVWHGERLTFDARLETPAGLAAGRPANTRITISGKPLSAGFDGTVKLGDAIDVTGQARASGGSLAATARWLGMEFPEAGPLGGFQMSGSLVANPQSVALNGATLDLGDTKASGVVLVAFRQKRPYLSADLQISALDVDRLSAGFKGGRALPPTTPLAWTPTRTTGAQPITERTPQSIEDLLRRRDAPAATPGAGRFAPAVRGYTNRNEWSAEPIDTSALALLDAKARLRIDGLRAAGLTIDRAVVRLALADRDTRIDIDDIQLYGGAGKGVITALPGRAGLGIGANLRVDKVRAKSLLSDAAAFDRLDGRGDIVLVVSGSGASQQAIAADLKGTAKFAFTDGAVVGWNLAKIMRGLQSGQFSNLQAAPDQQTDFSELAASFAIATGTATTSDLRLASPLLRVDGRGTIGIAARNLDLALRPKLVASLAGQGQSGSAAPGIEIPVKLKGPWHDPRIVPDFGGLTKDPAQLIGQAQELGRQFKGKSVGDIVRGVLGRN